DLAALLPIGWLRYGSIDIELDRPLDRLKDIESPQEVLFLSDPREKDRSQSPRFLLLSPLHLFNIDTVRDVRGDLDASRWPEPTANILNLQVARSLPEHPSIQPHSPGHHDERLLLRPFERKRSWRELTPRC